MKIQIERLLLCILIPLTVGALAGYFTSGSMEFYGELVKPALSPPGWLFPVVWSILYILLGISCYLILQQEKSAERKYALYIYVLQLIVNFIWSLVFFNGQNIFAAFIILVILWILIIAMIRNFYKLDQTAAYLQIPYLLWVTFAAYLNLSVYILN